MTLVLGALDGEVAGIASRLENPRTRSWHGVRIREGSLHGEPVVVARTGVGKVLSALACQHLVDETHPDRIVFVGVAGALNPGYEIGDTVIARDAMFHDMDVTHLGFRLGEVPNSGMRIFCCDDTLLSYAAEVVPRKGSAHVGRLLTGDQLVTSPEARKRLRDELDGDAVDMEGASIGMAAAVNGVAFLLLRTISDSAEGSVPRNFKKIIRYASSNACHYLSSMLERLARR